MRFTAAVLAVIGISLAAPHRAQAQTPLSVVPELSLAWWQLNPHLSHLWATTCPGDPSWRAGEGRGMAWAQQYLSMRSKTGYANVKDTIIPLYPRRRVRAVCDPTAVSGTITVADTVNWTGVRGEISVRGETLHTGQEMRDKYQNHSILNTAAYPFIKFKIDSVGTLTKTRGDTLRGKAFGVFELHGVSQPLNADVRTWRDPMGRRVSAKFMIPAEDMTDVYNMSKYALGLGVGGTVWEELWVGIDVILKPSGAASGQT